MDHVLLAQMAAQLQGERPPGMPLNDPVAMRQVTARLPAPRICQHCACAVRLVNNKTIFGSPMGEWPWLYLCTNRRCGAYVGTHPQTDIPLGTLATTLTREGRRRVKELFNPLWESGRMSREAAYGRLAATLGIPVAECHIALFDSAMCIRAAAACRAMYVGILVR